MGTQKEIWIYLAIQTLILLLKPGNKDSANTKGPASPSMIRYILLTARSTYCAIFTIIDISHESVVDKFITGVPRVNVAAVLMISQHFPRKPVVSGEDISVSACDSINAFDP